MGIFKENPLLLFWLFVLTAACTYGVFFSHGLIQVHITVPKFGDVKVESESQ